MDVNDLMTLKALDKEGMSPYEQFKIGHMQSKKASGTAIGALAVGVGAAVLAVGAGAWAGSQAQKAKEVAAAKNDGLRDLVQTLAGTLAAERNERINGDLNISSQTTGSTKAYMLTGSGSLVGVDTNVAIAHGKTRSLVDVTMGKAPLSGKYAIKLSEPRRDSETLVPSLGLHFDNEYGNPKVLYEHSHKMKSGHDYHTVLGRQLTDLSYPELSRVRDAFDMVLSKGLDYYPSVITEDYDEDEDLTLFNVSFDKPFDVQQASVAEIHNVETIDKQGHVYSFNDYDDAIMFAFHNAENLRMRGSLQKVTTDEGVTKNLVVIESANRYLGHLAVLDKGHVDFSPQGEGAPLVLATFNHLFDAVDFRKDVAHLESHAVQSIIDRTVDSSAVAFTDRQCAYIQAYVHQYGDSVDHVRARMEILFLHASVDQSYNDAGKLWREATLEDVVSFAFREYEPLLVSDDQSVHKGLNR